MNDIAIYGAGGFGREVALLIKQINDVAVQWNIIGFFDDGLLKGTIIDGYVVLGGMKDLNEYAGEIHLTIAVSDTSIRKRIVSGVSNLKVSYATLIHPNALVDPSVNQIGKGCIIAAGCIFTTNIKLGDFVIVNLLSTIGHDVNMNSFCSVMPGCNISGNIKFGCGVMIGTGVKILQNLTIGDKCKIGAGAVVTKSFSDEVTIVGIPARKVV